MKPGSCSLLVYREYGDRGHNGQEIAVRVTRDADGDLIALTEDAIPDPDFVFTKDNQHDYPNGDFLQVEGEEIELTEEQQTEAHRDIDQLNADASDNLKNLFARPLMAVNANSFTT